MNDLQNKLRQRLDELRSEYEAGERMLEELQGRQADLSQKLLRISGAIQVLEEELGERAASAPEEDGGG